jgi:uncharacterized Zn-binding protein involved in type VI secretion
MKRSRLMMVLCGAALMFAASPAAAEDRETPSAADAPVSVITGGSGNVVVGGRDAARKGDATDAGQPVVEGSSNVFINGRPAVRAGDRTNCGGVVVGGAANVFVNGKPLARSGDLTAGCPDK